MVISDRSLLRASRVNHDNRVQYQVASERLRAYGIHDLLCGRG
jgi:hypothetical protein